MLAIFSDIHLTDETTARNVDVGAFNHLHDAIVTAARREIDELHIVLLGDILDLVRTDYWHRMQIPMNERPWGGILDRETGMNSKADLIEAQFAQVLRDTLASAAGRALTGMLNALAADVAVPVRVTYVVGNHDRVFNNYPSLCAILAAAMPNVQVTFTNVLLAPEYGVLARHGHEWDDVCHGWRFARKALMPKSRMGQFDREAYNVMAIGEPITAELMSGLLYHTAQQLDMANPLDAEFFMNLQELNNLRPIFHVFHWLSWLARGKYQRYGDSILRAVRTSLNSLLASSLTKQWDKVQGDFLWWGDTAYQLGLLRTLLNTHITFDRLQWLVDKAVAVKNAMGLFLPHGDDDDMLTGAKAELDALDPQSPIQYVVYGHTHEARHDCFSAQLDGTVRMYINTGTYLPLIERARDGDGYVNANQMTMAYFYKGTEDTNLRSGPGPTLALWNGIRRKKHT